MFTLGNEAAIPHRYPNCCSRRGQTAHNIESTSEETLLTYLSLGYLLKFSKYTLLCLHHITPHLTTLSPLPLCHFTTHSRAPLHTAVKMVQENDVIAIIIIILFAVLALIAFGIYRLVSIARAGSNSSSSGQTSLADGDD